MKTLRARSREAHVLVIVQNLSVPLDRRVWLECSALRTRGYEVSVICPRGPDEPAREQLNGVHIYRYAPAPQAHGLLGYAWEFAYSWIRTALLSVRVWTREPFAILQACNPPDTYWLLALLWRPRGVRFVFDHHDLNPELFLSRFGAPRSWSKRMQYRGLVWLERRTFQAADRIISTNESYKGIAVQRGERQPDDITVVRSGPDTQRMRPIYPEHPRDPEETALVYLGIMGPQDGVDQVLLVMDELVHRRGHTNIKATLLGFGDCYDDLRSQSTRLGLDDYVTFTGRVDGVAIAEYLSRADIGLCPDPKTPLNDVSTMNKTMEYMSYGLPSVSFDLNETRVTGGDTVRYVPTGDIGAFADEIERLIDNPAERMRLGRLARERVSTQFDWTTQAEAYVSVFDDISGRHAETPAVSPANPASLSDPQGRRYVDLDDPDEFGRYLIERRGQ